ncbi:hypothetical protein [Latilactobacillus curvatus]|uniref:hypothetical protein n=1 Tax=Latilactobacillus curvatus TaxID=28038 RepID=UPI0020A5DF8F|nr:hypothetical protein [Latilactobacillus curvatus]MCS8581486.1 hypothetical protein [Latilactobacillus curvatus]MCS8605415.1 hypothetical protein [Latilactobacillus curvatus]UTB76861.1 hypothetical protein A4W74_09480 [Latilactobacillus curvatus]
MSKTALITMQPTDQTTGTTVIYAPDNVANRVWAAKQSNVQLISIPGYVRFGDHIVNFFVKKIVKQGDVSAYSNMLQFVYFSHMMAYNVANTPVERLVFATQDLATKVLMQFDNQARYNNQITVLAK